jgi:hypothetical protein
MTRTQIQLSDILYRQAKALAEAREISLAELVRNGLEYMIRVSAPPSDEKHAWTLPAPIHLGLSDPFADPDWRLKLHSGGVAEKGTSYKVARRKGLTK